MSDEWTGEEHNALIDLLTPNLSHRIQQFANEQSDDAHASPPEVQEAFYTVVETGLKQLGYERSHKATPEQERRFYEILKADYEAYQNGEFLEQFDDDWLKELYAGFEPPNPDDFSWSWEEDGGDD